MNYKARPTTFLHTQQKVGIQGRHSMDAHKTAATRRISNRERKLALMQDVDRLKKKLRQEENVHRALERAFTRPLGTLPRLPPYLPPYTLELLAEVAVLEEEVARLEEQVVQFRKGLYQEAVTIFSSKKNEEDLSDSNEPCLTKMARKDEFRDVIHADKTHTSCVAYAKAPLDDRKGKENQSCIATTKNKPQSPNRKPQVTKTPTKRSSFERKTSEKRSDTQKLQLYCRLNSQDNVEARSRILLEESVTADDNPNELSENILNCLLSIFSKMGSSRKRLSSEIDPSVTALSPPNGGNSDHLDPYRILSGFASRDIGPYKKLVSVYAYSINPNRSANTLFLIRRLKILFSKLISIKLQRLRRQQKLAFWINMYNSCMMNAFLEHGVPESPESVVALMQKATVNVGGHLLNAITIEHFILRLPYHSKYTFSKGGKKEEMVAQSIFGIELSEPLVTFALSCGSWSSPAVRIFTAAQVENELEVAKREYLQAAIGISRDNKLMIPKLLSWYLLDFAKDMDSLVDWICLQLPDEQRKQALKCLERSKSEPLSQSVHIMPYEFSFRYLLHS